MKIYLNGTLMTVSEGTTVLDAARAAGVYIPTLCHLKGLSEISACRICVVEADGAVVPACSTRVREGMTVFTDSPAVLTARRRSLELLCSDHSMDCTDCPRGIDCELRSLCRDYGADDRAFGHGRRERLIDSSLPHLVRDNSKCLICRRCEAVCRAGQTVGAIGVSFKGGGTRVGFAPSVSLADTACTGCGQCVSACPTGALAVKDDTKKVWRALFDRERLTAAVLSPEAGARFGAVFGDGRDGTGRLREFLRRIGFDLVLNAAAPEDERRELLLAAAAERDGPSIDAGCPAVRRFILSFFPQLETRLLPVPDRRELLAQRVRTHFPERDVFIAAIGNCTAAKRSPELFPGLDAVLTAREAHEMFRRACVSSFTAQQVWRELPDAPADGAFPPGGPPETVPELEERTLLHNGREMRVLEASGLKNVRRALERAEDYDLLLLHACPGGCGNGGGTAAPRYRSARLLAAEEKKEESKCHTPSSCEK